MPSGFTPAFQAPPMPKEALFKTPQSSVDRGAGGGPGPAAPQGGDQMAALQALMAMGQGAQNAPPAPGGVGPMDMQDAENQEGPMPSQEEANEGEQAFPPVPTPPASRTHPGAVNEDAKALAEHHKRIDTVQQAKLMAMKRHVEAEKIKHKMELDKLKHALEKNKIEVQHHKLQTDLAKQVAKAKEQQQGGAQPAKK